MGSDRVRAERAGAVGRVPRGGQATLTIVLGANRMLIAVSFGALLVVGAVLSLVSGSWWA